MPGLSRQRAGASGEVSRLEAPTLAAVVLRAFSVGWMGVISRMNDAVALLTDPGVAVRGGGVDVDPHPTVRHLRTREPRSAVGLAKVKGVCDINNPLQLDNLKVPVGLAPPQFPATPC
jgi:hypothetical protein